MQGTVKKWFDDRGFGFITREDGTDLFVHHSALQGVRQLSIGDAVTFETRKGRRGQEAANVSLATATENGGLPAEWTADVITEGQFRTEAAAALWPDGDGSEATYPGLAPLVDMARGHGWLI